MSKSLLGYVLIAVAVVGIIAAFGTLDSNSAIGMQRFGLAWGLGNGKAFGVLPLGLTVAALVAVGLIGVGLNIFGTKHDGTTNVGHESADSKGS